MTKHYTNQPYAKLGSKVWKINAGGTNYVDTICLKKAVAQLNIMESHYHQVNIIQFILHLPSQAKQPKNIIISRFMTKLAILLKARPYNLKRYGSLWVREQEGAKAPHYHVALIVDESRVHYPNKLFKILSELWEEVSNGGFLNWPPSPYMILDRGDEHRKGEIIYRLSYLAKLRSKGNRLPKTHDYSTSRLKVKI